MKELCAFLREASERFLSSNCGGYFESPIPCPLDIGIDGLVNCYLEKPDEDREPILSIFDLGHSSTFLAYAERMAALAVRQRSPEPVFRGLMGLVLEGFQYDKRENIMILALLYNSAVRIGSNPDEIFKKAIAIAPQVPADEMTKFLSRSPSGKSIEVMGYTECETKDGFRYERTW